VIINKFNIKINKNRVLNIIGCYKDNVAYMDILKIIDELENNFYSIISPKAIFEIKKSILTGYEKNIFVILTVGNNILLYSEHLFNNGEYLNGIIFNAMADDYLMQMDFFVCNEITKKCNSINLGVVKKFVPFENIDGKYQKIIADELDSFEKIGISANDRNILYPGKILSFIIGAKSNIKNENIIHNCTKCNKKDCRWRKCFFETESNTR